MTPAPAPTVPPDAAAPAPVRRFTPLVLLLFLGSGCAALVYEVVWFHQLRLVVGSSAVSLGFLLASFMGGMCLGSLLLPRLLPRGWHPLRVYAGLELLIGLCGFLLPQVLPVLGRFYLESVGHGLLSIVLRGVVCAAALLLPTMCMGATLPAIARWLDTTRGGLAAMGRFYAANILGAVAGTLLAGFWLLRVHDSLVATHVAVAINGAVAVLALLLAGVRRFVPLPEPAADAAPAPGAAGVVLLAIGASGATALGAEVVWTRLLGLLLGASVYTFSLILAVFLVGLGLGSAAGSRLGARVRSPWLWFALAQALLAPALLYSAWMIADVVPWLEPTRLLQEHAYRRASVRLPWDAARGLIAILPGPLLWGMSFPLALAAMGQGHRDPGRLVGAVSAANTLGAIAGALLVSLLALGTLGSQRTGQVLAGIAGATAVLLLLTARRPGARLQRAALALAAAALAAGSILVLPAVPNGLIAYGREVQSWDDGVDYQYVREGLNSAVAISDTAGCRNFHVAGKIEASTEYTDMRLQRMLGNLPALVHGRPRKVLIVGCGAGVTAGSFCAYPSVERIVICELEPRVIEASREFMAEPNCGVLTDRRTEIVLDDARHFLARTQETFDIITSDPIHPWVRGAAALYTLDYHQLVRRHLAPGGVVTLWVPLYQTDVASVKSQIGTFCRVFPHATLWNSDATDKGYDLALMAGLEPMAIDTDAIQEWLDGDAHLQGLLSPYGLGSALQLLRTCAGRAEDLAPWLADAQINDDVGLRLQYLAGLVIDCYDEAKIFKEIKEYRQWPKGLFRGDGEVLEQLRGMFPK